MLKGRKLWIAAGVSVSLIGAGVVIFRHGGHDKAPAGEQAAADPTDKWRGFAAGVPGMPGSDPQGGPHAPPVTAASPAEQKQQLELAVSSWRNAILTKDADTVVTLDRAFTENPVRFGPELEKMAQSDENERVRAFSTRVLGKLRAPQLAELFQKLLDDKSPYVRQNAAWSLGELGARPEGREAAQRAVAELRRIEQHDAAKDVRHEAGSALKRLQ